MKQPLGSGAWQCRVIAAPKKPEERGPLSKSCPAPTDGPSMADRVFVGGQRLFGMSVCDGLVGHSPGCEVAKAVVLCSVGSAGAGG